MQLGQRCQMLPMVMYFTDLSRIILLSAMVENKIQQKEKILFSTEQKPQTTSKENPTCKSQGKICTKKIPFVSILFTAIVNGKRIVET